MRKGVVIILAVAIIGALGVYGKSQPNAAKSIDNTNAAVQSASTNTAQPASSSSQTSSSGRLSDGTFTGQSEDTPYGPVQVAIVISGGRINDINFLQMPSDEGHSREVTAFSEPLLKQETLRKQSFHIDFVSGATSTSEGYEQSLQSALNQATVG